MKVISSLADIEFGIGKLTHRGDDLIVSSDASSTMATEIVVSPADGRAALKRLVFSAATWKFLLTLPFKRGRSQKPSEGDSQSWEARRHGTRLNKPW
ncbi:MAG: hypothetical protein AAF385_08240 [Pseudomonadota bacterium]